MKLVKLCMIIALMNAAQAPWWQSNPEEACAADAVFCAPDAAAATFRTSHASLDRWATDFLFDLAQVAGFKVSAASTRSMAAELASVLPKNIFDAAERNDLLRPAYFAQAIMAAHKNLAKLNTVPGFDAWITKIAAQKNVSLAMKRSLLV